MDVEKSSTNLQSLDSVIDEEYSSKFVDNHGDVLGNHVAIAIRHVLRERYVHLQVFATHTIQWCKQDQILKT